MDSELLNRFIDALMRIPEISQVMPNGRDALMAGLPVVGLNRSPTQPRLDLISILTGLDQLGRLDDAGGTRPLVAVAQNALRFVPTSSAVAKELQEVVRQLEDYYGVEIQPAPRSKPITGDEIVIGTDERLRVAFFRQALEVGRSVARLRVPQIMNGNPTGKDGFGTGWLIAPGLLMTNHHVIEARFQGDPPAGAADFRAQAEATITWFDFHDEAALPGLQLVGTRLEAADQNLDYALIRLADPAQVADRTPLRIIPLEPELSRGDRLNIVQHPQGGVQKYAIRNNFFVGTADEGALLRYVTDTEPGASGSPVSDDSWFVVGLHHASTPADPAMVPKEIFKDEVVLFNNEGIAIHKILNNVNESLRAEIKQAQGIA
jgi:endonuclease G